MSAELPDIDNPVSYVVDGGESVGPIPMREIVQSIAAEQRSDDVLVWWTGVAEWMPFKSHECLVELLDDDAQEVDDAEEEEILLDLVEAERKEPAEVSVTSQSNLAGLSALGERLAALASATRHLAASAKLERAGAAPIDEAANRSISFDSLLDESANFERLADESSHVIDVLARACAAAFARDHYDVERSSTSSGSHELVISRSSGKQGRLQLRPAPSVGHEGQYVSVLMAWGYPTSEVHESVDLAAQQLMAPSHTGTISTELDLTREAVLTRVELVWPIDRYIDADLDVDQDALNRSLEVIQQALENRWHEMFSPS